MYARLINIPVSKSVGYKTSWQNVGKCEYFPCQLYLPANTGKNRSTGDQKVTGSTPAEVGNILSHSVVEIDHEIFSTVILSLPLIQEGQLSVSEERMCTILVNRLED